MGNRKIRIGIDVGGTFTHSVAIDASNFQIIGKVKLPTTHTADIGVAKGIIDCLHKLLEECKIEPDEVCLIAHSTTQATNALLEGDVAPVGIIGMGTGFSALWARAQTNIRNIELAPNRFLKTFHTFIDSKRINPDSAKQAILSLKERGAEVFVASEAFSVDDATNEELVLKVAQDMGLLATATHQISQLHGLKIRTRTAVINSSMLPKMLETANMTEKAVKETGIKAPLMIMRSDGGIMDIEAMRKRPILTMLSGPAAGVAAALLYARISDGIFLEVGGTSTDISAIKNGKSQIKTAEVGGNKVFLHTLDVRTIGVAGGSVAHIHNDKIIDVGPRSAHIAGIGYAAFSSDSDAGKFKLDDYFYYERDKEHYLTVQSDGKHFALTPTCAANYLNFIKEDDYAFGNQKAINSAFKKASEKLGIKEEKIAEEILDIASEKAEAVVESLIRDYKLDKNIIKLIGGGGGASALVHYLGKKMSIQTEIVKNSEVISAIGVALALVRDMIEKTIIDPNETDIIRIREEAVASVQRMGADPSTIEVFVEIDSKKNIVRATAMGSTEMKEKELVMKEITEENIMTTVAQSISCNISNLQVKAQTTSLKAYSADITLKRAFGLFTEKRTAVRVVDGEGVIRLANNKSAVTQSTVNDVERDLVKFAELYTSYSDAGVIIPKVFILIGSRILDFSGLIEMNQIIPLLQIELKHYSSEEPVGVVLNF